MPAFPDVQKPARKQNIFPKIPGARSANLIHTHEILHKQCSTTRLLVSAQQSEGNYRPACPIRFFKLRKPTDQIHSLCQRAVVPTLL